VEIAGLAADYLPDDFMMPGMTAHAVFILKLMASMIGVWLWGLSLWYGIQILSRARLDPSAETVLFLFF